MTLPLPPTAAPDLHLHVVGRQDQALSQLRNAEREELSQQLLADSQRQDLTAALLAARRRSFEARTALTAWTNAARSLDWSTRTTRTAEQEVVDRPDDEEEATEDWFRTDTGMLGDPGDVLLDDALLEDDVFLHVDDPELQEELPLDVLTDLDDPEEDWSPGAAPWEEADRVTLKDHARSAALELVTRHRWEDGLDVLTEVLNRPRWGKLRTTIDHYMGLGMTADEFELSWALRAEFRERTELNVTPCRDPFRMQFDTPGLRWSVAWALARQFPGLEADLLLTRVVNVCRSAHPEGRHDCWSERIERLMETFPDHIDGEYWLSVLEERA